MLSRVRWLGAGVAMGAGGSLWAQRKVKSVAARYRPSGLAGEAAERAKGLPGELRAAIREGRHAMREREAELRSGGPGQVLRRQGATRPGSHTPTEPSGHTPTGLGSQAPSGQAPSRP